MSSKIACFVTTGESCIGIYGTNYDGLYTCGRYVWLQNAKKLMPSEVFNVRRQE